MNKQTITRENLGEIAAIACQSWKSKLEEYARRNPYGSTIEFTDSEVDEMFNAADLNQKPTLLKFFKQQKGITERVTCYTTACQELGITPDSKASGYERLKTIIKALNQGWFPNWENDNEYKWYNWFKSVKGVPSFIDCDCVYSGWGCPSALYFKTEALARHCAKIAEKEYQEYLTDK